MADPARDPGPLRTLLVALLVCAACSIVVSATAVWLAPLHRANRERDRRAHAHALIERQPGLGALLGDVSALDVREVVVDLASGAVADWIDPARFDLRAAQEDPLRSTALPAERDLAGLGRRANHGTAYVVSNRDGLALVLLPVHGRGYSSTIRGYVALGSDANTVRGVSFYEHAETPGVGGEVLSDDEWLAQWIGRHARDHDGRVRIGTSQQPIDPEGPDAAYLVDTVSGATRTTGGVGSILRFWLGDDGYGPFLRRLAAEGLPR